eukprot:TRINITY_DN6206_c0_g3_i5.p1 TRINITY_DN6206_c0_g3~~TRINITY_DN6206_c0_g3_i5.p1  ORF type:complete len:279 (+),score=94.59 TRINITY_DN6206_c0_g3_i5:203-1039(+)
MGAGIAQVTAAAGPYSVQMVDLSEDVLAKGRAGIEKSLKKVAGKRFKDSPAEADAFVGETLSRLSFTADTAAAVADTDLVIEAIVENMDVKKKVFAQLDAQAQPSALFASNTSSLSVTEMAKATNRAAQFGGLHFFSPVPLMRLVEVVDGEHTSAGTSQALYEFSQKVGKQPVRCKDTPGFVVNRLLVPYLMEAVRLHERGVASVADIDTAMTLGAGHPMGPFRLADNVGNDVLKFIVEGWHQKNPDDPLFKPSAILDKLVADKKLGVKAGEGWYKYA